MGAIDLVCLSIADGAAIEWRVPILDDTRRLAADLVRDLLKVFADHAKH
jgi:hypothetical protein